MARSALKRLVFAHQGNLSAIARALGVSRQAAARRLKAAQLLELAAAQRFAAGVSGPRLAGDQVDDAVADERQRLVRALRATDSDEAARVRLGLARRSFYRRKAALAPADLDDIAQARARRAVVRRESA